MSRLIEWDSVKLKLRLNDDTLKEEISLYIQEVDDLVNNRVRNKLGTVDFNGDQIDLPLTVEGEPSIDEELKSIATDAVIGKFRLQNSEKPLIWDTAMKNLDNYLDRRFGYTRDTPFRQKPQASVTPAVGTPLTIVTLKGEKWGKNTKLTFQFGANQAEETLRGRTSSFSGIPVSTSPSTVITDENGRFENVTFVIPSNATVNETTLINITDGRQATQLKFTVIPFTKAVSMDGVLV